MSKKKKIALLLLLLCLMLVAGYHFLNQKTPQITGGLPSTQGTKKMSDKDVKAYANKKVSASQVSLEVYPEVTISGTKGSLYIHNVPTNKVGQQAFLYDENNQMIAQTGLIKPGYEVDTITTSSQLATGNHKGRIQLIFYDLSKEEQVGKTSVAVSIEVKGE